MSGRSTVRTPATSPLPIRHKLGSDRARGTREKEGTEKEGEIPALKHLASDPKKNSLSLDEANENPNKLKWNETLTV